MPNAKVLSEKQAMVAELAEKMKNATAGVLVDYKGITVEEDTKLRSELRKANVEPDRLGRAGRRAAWHHSHGAEHG